MQTEMHCEDAHDEFQEVQEQYLTYHLSQQIPSSPLSKYPKKHIPKISEKHKLELVIAQREIIDAARLRDINKNIKSIQASLGKIIKINNATFRSNFECGNLSSVTMTGPSTYQIELEKQTNSNRTSGWFYFSVEGIRGEAHFVIKGFTKSASLYNQGMKICYRDIKDISKWRRGGTRIVYTNSEDQQQQQKPKYQLRFSHFFKNNENTCIQFAYCFPYGLKKLYGLISNIKDMVQISVLAKTFNGQDMPLLSIGNPNSPQVIVLSARVHPGETVSSFIMEGFLKELVGDNQYGKLLRSQFLFKIVPMLNPDGVLRGNYRFSGYGCDLNRKWKACKENSQPQIYFMRDLIKCLNKQKKVVMYIDIHGHSRKKNVFFYGCCEKGPEPNSKPKQFPFLMEKIFNAYKYENCCFAMQKDKEGTARITVWKEIKSDYVYTLESTFCGPEYGPNYLEADYQKIGKKLCEGMAIFFYQPNSIASHSQLFRNTQKMALLKKKAFEELMESPKLLKVGDEDDSGSESEPEVGQIPQKQRNPQTGLPKPESIIRQFREELKAKKIKMSNKRLSNPSISQNFSLKIKSQAYVDDQIPKRVTETSQKERKNQHAILIQSDNIKTDKIEIKIANSINTFELETLRASSLYQKNVRVHSITRNNQDYSDRSRKVVNPFIETNALQDRDQRLRINLIHGREGAQYRRVRKIAEQNMKKELFMEDNGRIVKGISTNQLEMDGSSSTAIAPRFYPLSQQRTRRTSLESYIKRQPKLQQFKRLCINGDELNVRCIGKHVYL